MKLNNSQNVLKLSYLNDKLPYDFMDVDVYHIVVNEHEFINLFSKTNQYNNLCKNDATVYEMEYINNNNIDVDKALYFAYKALDYSNMLDYIKEIEHVYSLNMNNGGICVKFLVWLKVKDND